MASVFVFLCLQLLKCVLRDLLEEKEVQKSLLQVHLNGTDSSPDLIVFIQSLRTKILSFLNVFVPTATEDIPPYFMQYPELNLISANYY